WSVRHFPDYAKAVEFLLAVARLAEKQQHHPELKLGYGFVEIEVWTHDVRGLTGKDEALAEAIDLLGLE
ncbi:MAG TPA: 4a-hydroxytetrahydrobiopterin dehydratase, partial [Planctomycetota bacterium]|nr:4a-hydroxytetrahydrobiopterin dehydratase [Planctomycetota bacterium]